MADFAISPLLDRRALLAGMAGTLLSAAGGSKALARPVAGLDILGAPTGASIALARVVESGVLAETAPGATFRLWRDPDELRAGIVSGKTRLFSTPTHVPANLANRGLPIRLLCLLGRGHLYVVTAEEGVSSFKDLAGKPVLGFFRNDMPDLVFRACARMEGLDPDKDLQLSYVQSGMEAAQFLAAGKARTAVLSEPAATAAIMMAGHQGVALKRAISLQQVWAAHKNTNGIPMVGVAVHQSLLDEEPAIIPALKESLPKARDWALANKAEAGLLAEKVMQNKPQIFEKALDHFNMEIVSAQEAKADLVSFYETILQASPDALAGKVPGDDFFLSW